MKKIITAMLLAMALFTLASFGQKVTCTLAFDERYHPVLEPVFSGGSMGWQETEDAAVATFTVSQDGEYTLVVEDVDHNEYTLIITKNGGKVDVKSDDNITFELNKK